MVVMAVVAMVSIILVGTMVLLLSMIFDLALPLAIVSC